MSNTSSSAIIGQPPHNIIDVYIARYLASKGGAPGPLNAIDVTHGLHNYPVPAPNVSHANKRLMIMVASVIFSVLTGLFTVVRLGLRWHTQGHKWGWDDWMIIPGTAFAIANNAIFYYQAQSAGLGKRLHDITYVEMKLALETGVLSTTFFYVATGFIKISIACFLKRVIGKNLNAWRRFLDVLLVILWCYTICNVFMWMFWCGDPRWRMDIVWAGQQSSALHCRKFITANAVMAAIHTALDFALLGVGLSLFYVIKLTWKRKISLAVLFVLALASCTFSVTRTIVEHKMGSEFLWDLVIVCILIMADNFTACIVANLPSINGYLNDRAQQRERRLQDELRHARRGGTPRNGQETTCLSTAQMTESTNVESSLASTVSRLSRPGYDGYGIRVSVVDNPNRGIGPNYILREEIVHVSHANMAPTIALGIPEPQHFAEENSSSEKVESDEATSSA